MRAQVCLSLALSKLPRLSSSSESGRTRHKPCGPASTAGSPLWRVRWPLRAVRHAGVHFEAGGRSAHEDGRLLPARHQPERCGPSWTEPRPSENQSYAPVSLGDVMRRAFDVKWSCTCRRKLPPPLGHVKKRARSAGVKSPRCTLDWHYFLHSLPQGTLTEDFRRINRKSIACARALDEDHSALTSPRPRIVLA